LRHSADTKRYRYGAGQNGVNVIISVQNCVWNMERSVSVSSRYAVAATAQMYIDHGVP